MDALAADTRGDFQMIVDHQRHRVIAGDRQNASRETFDLRRREFFRPNLQDIDSAFAKRCSHRFHVLRLHIAEVDDAVESCVLNAFHAALDSPVCPASQAAFSFASHTGDG
jgi:hypothetical protein